MVFKSTAKVSMNIYLLYTPFIQWDESGSDDPDLGHLGHFLVGQVGLIR